MDNSPRQTAFDVLLHWHRAHHTLDRSLEKHSNQISHLSPKDRTLCNAIIFGVLRHRESIDWIIKAFSNASLDKIQLKLLYILRIALYQIIYLDRVPDFAAINTAVEMGKQYGGKRSAGFLNAVLRKAAKNHTAVTLPDKIKSPARHVSIAFALPLWLAERWVTVYGIDKACALGEQINTVPMITARTNTLKIKRNELAQHLTGEAEHITPTNYSRQGLKFTRPATAISDLKAFRKGFFQIQDEAAQLVTDYLSPEPGERILDACAGLGGKTCHMAQLMENKGHITAVDIEGYKLEALQAEAVRLGISIIRTKTANLIKTTVKDFNDYFDRVLVDSPCTGLGVIQRNPDTKWKRRPQDISRLSGRQKKILNAAANFVKPGGILVYAVCSCEVEENENVIHAFLNKRKDYLIDNDFNYDNFASLMSSEGFIKTYPETNNMDGFFAARLRRKLK